MKPLILKVDGENSKTIQTTSCTPSPNISSLTAKNCYLSQNYFQTEEEFLRSRSCSGSIEIVSPLRISSYDRLLSTSTQNSLLNVEQSPQFKSNCHSAEKLEEQSKNKVISPQNSKTKQMSFIDNNLSPTKIIEDNYYSELEEMTGKSLSVKRRAPSRNLL